MSGRRMVGRLRLALAGVIAAVAIAGFLLLMPPAVRVARLVDHQAGTVRVVDPGNATSAVLVLSDAGGWTTADDSLARRLSHGRRLVIGVDSASLTGHLLAQAKPADTCLWVMGDLERLSQQIQRAHGVARYRPPALVGSGAGARLAYAALSEAMPATFAGAVGIGFDPVVQDRLPPCMTPDAVRDGATLRLPPAASLQGVWRPLDVGAEQEDRVEAQVSAILTDPSLPAEVTDLPLVELPAQGESPILAVILSGDGGWRDIDRQIGERFQAEGIATVGLDSLQYFWSRRTPQEVADDLGRTLRTYMKRWGKTQVLLAGYSFGADVLPAALNRLAPDLKPSIRLVSLIGFAPRADFEITAEGFWGSSSSDSIATGPEVARLSGYRLACVFGSEETEADSACRSATMDAATRIEMPGGHHFDGQYQQIADRLLALFNDAVAAKG
ncbi:virulence factor family protein [Zavarzinia sp. CC-PAN008]|uniref:virulence factor family protein n=1 Tax=Zavarzinia sp. CC-PAN008 TaxID=3243332 RepID=UPI003F743DFA